MNDAYWQNPKTQPILNPYQWLDKNDDIFSQENKKVSSHF